MVFLYFRRNYQTVIASLKCTRSLLANSTELNMRITESVIAFLLTLVVVCLILYVQLVEYRLLFIGRAAEIS